MNPQSHCSPMTSFLFLKRSYTSRSRVHPLNFDITAVSLQRELPRSFPEAKPATVRLNWIDRLIHNVRGNSRTQHSMTRKQRQICKRLFVRAGARMVHAHFGPNGVAIHSSLKNCHSRC